MSNPYADLREQAERAIANYLHHRLFDEVAQVNMLPWIREQASTLLDGLDNAVEKTKGHGRKLGLL